MLNRNSLVDTLFRGLTDPTRREMAERLSLGPMSVSALADPLTMTLSGVVQHLAILEDSGLARSEKIGRVRICRIEPAALRTAEHWFAERQSQWELRLDRLGAILAEDDDGRPRGD